MKRLMIECPECRSTGEIPLSTTLSDTLHCARNLSKGIACGATSRAIYMACSDSKYIQISAINNRLVKLEELGLVRRERRGKEFHWYPILNGRPKTKTKGEL